MRFDCQDWPYKLVAFITNLRSHFRGIFTGDQAYFVRTQSFQTVGGYPDQPLMEDLEKFRFLEMAAEFYPLPLPRVSQKPNRWVSAGTGILARLQEGPYHTGLLAYAAMSDAWR